ncbi:MAG TPA: response regulator transcription factor [Candidatus Saccharimonadales bacterium]|nr:response regulator transcription factor [Candidatus Saccharimonadales bacterium]
MRILVVEDERTMAELLKRGLEEEHHSVCVATDGQSGLDQAEGSEFDVIVLDVMLPKVDGFEIVRRLRSAKDHTPILMLTARDAVSDIARGLDAGVDDYLTKPFSFVELLARLRALARRANSPMSLELKVGDLILDPLSRQVTRDHCELHLTVTEFKLLELLMRRAGRVVTRDTIVDAVWGTIDDVGENTLDVFISVLRNKIDKGTENRLIHTIRGVGYMIRERP